MSIQACSYTKRGAPEKKNFENLDEDSFEDNGGLTYVTKHRKMFKAITFWMGYKDQLEFKTLTPVYYRNYLKSQLVGRMAKDLKTIEGTGALFTHRMILIIATFKLNIP